MTVCVRAKSLSQVRLCDPMGCGPPGSSVHGILQARTLEWVAMPASRGSSRSRDQTHVSSPALAGGFFATSTTWRALNNMAIEYLSKVFIMMCELGD